MGISHTNNHSLTMHGMPHAGLLWWHSLLWGHYPAHRHHRGGSHMGLTLPGRETLVTRQLCLHLFLLAGTTHRANTQTKETQFGPSQYKVKHPQK